jgi:hypothetical protein
MRVQNSWNLDLNIAYFESGDLYPSAYLRKSPVLLVSTDCLVIRWKTRLRFLWINLSSVIYYYYFRESSFLCFIYSLLSFCIRRSKFERASFCFS